MLSRRVWTQPLRTALLAVFFVTAFSSAGRAAPLNLMLQDYPDIMAGYIDATYIGGVFQAQGWALQLYDGTTTTSLTSNPDFRITANISNTGVASGGTLTIWDTASTLLSSTSLLTFGFYPQANGILEFVFGGPLTGSYVPGVFSSSAPVGVILSGLIGFPGSWSANWTTGNTYNGVADVGPLPAVPEPSTLTLLLLGAGGGVVRQFRKRARRTRGVPAPM